MKKIFYFKENEPLNLLVDYLLSFKNLEAILLDGELGAGKTTLTSQIAKKLNEKKIVISPTFNTMISYEKFIHIDAYKLRGDLFAYEEYFENKIVIIEWSKNIKHNFKYFFNINVSLQQINNEVYHVFEITNQTVSKGIFIESSLEDFFVALVENNKIIDYILIEKLVKKTDSFFDVINLILERNNINFEYLDEIYTTLGPGSFTGSRLGFVFASTNKFLQNSILNNDIKIKLLPTYELFFKQFNSNLVYIKANKYKAYKIEKNNDKLIINLVDEVEKINHFDYQKMILNSKEYLILFKEKNNLLDEELIYGSEPQIGGN
ncbi:tRNA (adenosine(37)-N6)-threonylcarbamoyltransferase complex ATPase subunit type 1 TsaE [Metamycoplasma canadense]|uniref:tRNA threonylcarbamoyladenosine biosynthesis protein TsaE n=1 Tax=Metamycoplasma canadense TaxID=29554 RepID=A0A077L6E3_9BACT|nr:tRNA (adenosine(37)-N6)-threonylcarbamoyltransferase complex ATPase subunit type 1 TsaE [Metamycoplasma canadense]BAP39537.1 hypothetical protein MCAN360_0354 [Metamycoplasma canadense]